MFWGPRAETKIKYNWSRFNGLGIGKVGFQSQMKAICQREVRITKCQLIPCWIRLVVVIVQSPSHVHLFVTPWPAACQVSLTLTISLTASVMPSSHLILWRPLLLLPLIFPSIRDFSSELSVRIRWPKYWSFRFGVSPSSEYSGLISFRIDWFDFLAGQGTLRSLL